jgi:Fe2+ or Zn2+ uptake regulation protein
MANKRKWRSMPVENEIFSILIKNRGEILTTDLLRQLKLTYKDITRSELQDTLFRLEVRSFIYLIEIKKGEFKIEISPFARFSNGIRKQVQEFMRLN